MHKQECQMLQDSRLNNLSGSLASVSESAMLEHSIFENSRPQFLDDDREELLHNDTSSNLSDDSCVTFATNLSDVALDSAQHSAVGKKLLEKSASKKLKREKFRNDGYVSCSKDETINCDLAPTTSSSTLSAEVSLEGVSVRHKVVINLIYCLPYQSMYYVENSVLYISEHYAFFSLFDSWELRIIFLPVEIIEVRTPPAKSFPMLQTF